MNQFTLVAVTAVLVALYHNYFAPQPAVWVAPSQLKLTYFAGPGRAELSRLILSAGNPTLPLGQVPVLEDPLECLRVDMVSESLVDVKTLISEIAYRTPDEAAKTEKTKKLLEESVPKTYKLLEEFIQKGPFFLGDKMTYGDLQLYDLTKNGLGNFAGFSLSKYPKLTTLVSKVESNPNVAAYLVKHQQ
ncbi:glutathione S-transferase, putative [Phytophthora infestans T30-4]|uniref:Glutathione S-transferase, putative n=1 Tax=Phytophthora infestans (strain T30-4) TaxID=403677 RepID=D0RM22_PHYIT|nr:glutathione S-transferase, putative [Phytophthora infestans T30-4]EEY58495.1 glutathione S-transferase, putative [Phytophthora infestans T30-4]|eukprot:XP_002909908.1 glutathione S-transferase, putative [Phytophthora infestans T30-4]